MSLLNYFKNNIDEEKLRSQIGAIKFGINDLINHIFINTKNKKYYEYLEYGVSKIIKKIKTYISYFILEQNWL